MVRGECGGEWRVRSECGGEWRVRVSVVRRLEFSFHGYQFTMLHVSTCTCMARHMLDH